jgi:hypothetical protein
VISLTILLRTQHSELIIWLGEEDSNPRKQVQSLSSYHWTIPQFGYGDSTISKTLASVKGKPL